MVIIAAIAAFLLHMLVLHHVGSAIVGLPILMLFIGAPALAGRLFGGLTEAAYHFAFVLSALGAPLIILLAIGFPMGMASIAGMVIALLLFFLVQRTVYYKYIYPHL